MASSATGLSSFQCSQGYQPPARGTSLGFSREGTGCLMYCFLLYWFHVPLLNLLSLHIPPFFHVTSSSPSIGFPCHGFQVQSISSSSGQILVLLQHIQIAFCGFANLSRNLSFLTPCSDLVCPWTLDLCLPLVGFVCLFDLLVLTLSVFELSKLIFP